MRYLVTARLRESGAAALKRAIDDRTLGRGSVAHGEYGRNMAAARQLPHGVIKWVEVCFCPTPLEEERPYWEKHFELVRVLPAHSRSRCRDENGTEPWACSDCDCTRRLEERLESLGEPFADCLTRLAESSD